MTKLLEEVRYIFMDLDPNTVTPFTLASNSGWLNIEEYHRVTCIVFRTVGTGKFTCSLKGATDGAGTGSTSIVGGTSTNATGLLGSATWTSAVTANVGRIVFDLTHDDIVNTLENCTHLTTETVSATQTDEFGVLFILSEPRYAAATAATQSSGNG